MISSPITELKAVTTNKLPSSFTHGPQIGTYKGYPIFAWLKDNHGVMRTYKGLATSDEGHAPGSIITTPGLLYEPSVAMGE